MRTKAKSWFKLDNKIAGAVLVLLILALGYISANQFGKGTLGGFNKLGLRQTPILPKREISLLRINSFLNQSRLSNVKIYDGVAKGFDTAIYSVNTDKIKINEFN